MLRASYWILIIACALFFLFHLWHVTFPYSANLLQLYLLMASMFCFYIVRILLVIGFLKVGKIPFRIAVSANLPLGVALLYDAAVNWLFTLAASICTFLFLLLASTVVYWLFPLFRFAVTGVFLSYMLIIGPKPTGASMGSRNKSNLGPEYLCPKTTP